MDIGFASIPMSCQIKKLNRSHFLAEKQEKISC